MMSMNDVRSNMCINLYNTWSILYTNKVEAFSDKYEHWNIIWKDELLIIKYKGQQMAKVSDEKVFLDESITKDYEFPIKSIRKYLAQSKIIVL